MRAQPEPPETRAFAVFHTGNTEDKNWQC